MVVESGDFLTLEAGHAGPHDLVDKEEVGGDHGAAIDHLLFDSAIKTRCICNGNLGYKNQSTCSCHKSPCPEAHTPLRSHSQGPRWS